MTNIPAVKLGLVAVSRDCFPIELSRKRRAKVATECRRLGLKIAEIPTIVENEAHALEALDKLRAAGANALVLYLGNFGPEGPTTILAQRFGGPVMFAAAAEETGQNLVDGRGDAYCGMLNASYNIGLRKLRPYIPEYPVGTAEEVAAMIAGFVPVARVLLGLKGLKVFAFGPRPQDFLACNAPIKPLYDLGVEVMENSELDLYDVFLQAKGAREIKAVAKDMARELGAGNAYPDLLEKLAQFEVGLMNFIEGQPGRFDIRRLRRQVLAGLREVLRLRALLRQLAPGRPRHPRGLRGGHLRRLERVHGRLRDAAPGHPARHQQHRPGRHGQGGRQGAARLQADRPVHGLPLRQHAVLLPGRTADSSTSSSCTG